MSLKPATVSTTINQSHKILLWLFLADLYDVLLHAVVVLVECQVLQELIHLGLRQWHCATSLVYRFQVGLDTSDGARSSYIDQCINLVKSYCLGEGTACKFMTKLFLYGFKGKLAENNLFCRLDRNSNIYPLQGNQIHTFVNCTLKL